jgi:hypothetical protein
MPECPSCRGLLIRLPSSRLDQFIGRLTGKRPYTCCRCLWVGRCVPPPDDERGARPAADTLPNGEPVPHRRRGEPVATCPICGHGSISRLPMHRFDEVIARLTGRVPLLCGYCHWQGRRRAHARVRELDVRCAITKAIR